MFDSSLAPVAYAVLAVAAVALAFIAAGIVVAVRDFRGVAATPVQVTVTGPSHDLRTAA